VFLHPTKQQFVSPRHFQQKEQKVKRGGDRRGRRLGSFLPVSITPPHNETGPAARSKAPALCQGLRSVWAQQNKGLKKYFFLSDSHR